MSPIFFYFDLVSPYAYLASNLIETLAAKHGREVEWRPFRIGVAVVKVMGLKPAMETPLKSDYIRTDVSRMAKVLGLGITSNLQMFDPVPAQRVLHGAKLEDRARLAKALLHARWVEDLDLTNNSTLVDIAGSAGVDGLTVQNALESLDTKIAVRHATEEAIALGVFGSPTFRIENELFWGVDRLWLVDHYLQEGCRYIAAAGDSASKS
ncbi:2-hydroxychromene-2-carboxylate isomerase [Pseudomonas abietaniphila]|uniref:2-hydroxychromene-2-carboxylate isomerase n=1 Tax=Pseudomonas abietaniphila TaxID=89065 RepID=UPI0032179CDB